MMSVSQNGTLAELIAALLPCMWSYWEIGKRLNDILEQGTMNFW